MKRLLAGTIAAGLLAVVAVATAGPPDDESGDADSDAEMGSIRKAITAVARKGGELESAGDQRGAAGVDEVLDEIRGAATPQKLFDWVRANIRFEPYEGTMRGPVGTLEARAGNAADQTQLLAKLLDEAGHDYRFATGTLPDVDARELVTKFASKAALVATDEVRLKDTLGTDAAVGKQRFLNLVQDHVWLEVKTDQEWTTADPVLGGSFGGERIKPDAHHDALPKKHEAKLRVSLRAHFTDGQDKRVATIEGPMSRFAYQSIELRFRPSEKVEDTLVPLIGLGDDTLEGDRFLPDELDILLLEYRARVGQVERHYEHVLFRRDSQADNLFDHDNAVISVSVLPGWTSGTRLANLAGRALERAAQVFKDATPSEDGGTVERAAADRSTRAALTAAGSVAPLVYAHHLDHLTKQLAHTVGVQPILLQPRIIRAILVRDGSELSVDLDTRGGRLEAVPAKGMPESAATGFLTLFGRLESQLRRQLVHELVGRKPVTVNTIFEKIQEDRIPIGTIHNGNLERLEKIDISDQARKVMRNQVVERGWILLTPLERVEIEGHDHFGWWSVEPLTGLMRGNLAGGLADLKTDIDQNQAAPSKMLSTGAKLLARLYRSTRDSRKGQADYTDLVCESLDDTRLVARSLCATKKLLSLPELTSCGADPSSDKSDGEGGIVDFAGQGCKERVAKTRCGAAVATAFLKGKIEPMYASEDSDDGESYSKFSCVGN